MTARHDPWKILARAARQAGGLQPETPPFGFEARALAAWRAQSAPGDSLPWRSLLRGALACASLIMLACLGLTYYSLTSAPATDTDVLEMADSVIRMSFNR